MNILCVYATMQHLAHWTRGTPLSVSNRQLGTHSAALRVVTHQQQRLLCCCSCDFSFTAAATSKGIDASRIKSVSQQQQQQQQQQCQQHELEQSKLPQVHYLENQFKLDVLNFWGKCCLFVPLFLVFLEKKTALFEKEGAFILFSPKNQGFVRSWFLDCSSKTVLFTKKGVLPLTNSTPNKVHSAPWYLCFFIHYQCTLSI